MALLADNLLFLHIPKTAGIWIRNLLKDLGLNTSELGTQHTHFPELKKFVTAERLEELFLFTFVRHPLSWYQSRWAFRMKHGWRTSHPLDFNCMSNDFNDFVDRVLKYQPNGWVTWLYSQYIDNSPKKLDGIGRMERLEDNLIELLNIAGVQYDENFVRSYGRVNDSDMDGKTSKSLAVYDELVARRVLAVEQKVIDLYYYDIDVNIEEFCCA